MFLIYSLVDQPVDEPGQSNFISIASVKIQISMEFYLCMLYPHFLNFINFTLIFRYLLLLLKSLKSMTSFGVFRVMINITR